MPRPSNRKERRKQIVEAFRLALSELGYEKATNQAVASRAGLAPGLIHYHFKNKQEILLELVLSMRDAWEARYEALKKDSEGPFQHLSAVVQATLMGGQSAQPEMVAAWVAIGNEALRQKEVGDTYRSLTGQIHGELVKHLSSLLDSPDQVNALAGMTLAAMEGVFQVSATNPALIPGESAAPTLLSLLQSALNQ